MQLRWRLCWWLCYLQRRHSTHSALTPGNIKVSDCFTKLKEAISVVSKALIDLHITADDVFTAYIQTRHITPAWSAVTYCNCSGKEDLVHLTSPILSAYSKAGLFPTLLKYVIVIIHVISDEQITLGSHRGESWRRYVSCIREVINSRCHHYGDSTDSLSSRDNATYARGSLQTRKKIPHSNMPWLLQSVRHFLLSLCIWPRHRSRYWPHLSFVISDKDVEGDQDEVVKPALEIL